MARCFICDTELSETEINFGEDDKLEPCTTCLRIIMDTAYCDGFEPYADEDDAVAPDLDEVDFYYSELENA